MRSRLDVASLIVRLVIGAIFFYAGQAKLVNPTDLALVIGNYHLVPKSLETLIALLLPTTELILGSCLILGLATRASALLTCILGLGFAGAVGSALLRGLNVECGCFSGKSQVSWIHLGLDVLLIAGAGWLIRVGAPRWGIDSSRGERGYSSRLTAIGGPVLLALNLALLVFSGRAQSIHGTSRPGPEKSSIVFDQPVLDLGDVRQGFPAVGKIGYHNASNRRVNIMEANTGCGCTIPKLSKSDLDPGERGEMTITYNPTTSQGPINNWVKLVLADSPEQPELVVKVNVLLLLEPTPGLLRLTKVGEAKLVSLKSTVQGLDYHVTEVDIPDPALSVTLLGYPTVGTAKLSIKLTAPLKEPPKPIDAWSITVNTDISDAPPAVIYVQGDWAK